MLIEIAIYSLAAWRVANLLVHERGPFDMFVRIREVANIEHDEDGYPFMFPDNFLADVLSCVWCTSIWIAAFFVFTSLLFPTLTLKFATIFAISAGAIMIDKYINKE